MTGPRIGIFGGLFDPVHLGHVALARHVIDHYSLNRLYLVPCGDPPHKPGPRLDGDGRRLLLEAAFRSDPRIFVNDLELRRAGPSYAIDTILAIAEQDQCRPWYFMGADNLAEMKTWKSPDRILQAARVVAVTRPGSGDLSAFPEYAGRIEFLAMPGVAVSSSLIRDRLASGTDVTGLMPAPVLHLIRKNGWYGAMKPSLK